MPARRPYASLLDALWEARMAADDAAIDLQQCDVLAPATADAIEAAVTKAHEYLSRAGQQIRAAGALAVR